MDPQNATPYDCEFPFQIGDTVRNVMTGKTYKVREVLKTVAIVQRGSTAIKVRLENLEPVEL